MMELTEFAAPSLSVADSVTRYVPSLSGVKVNSAELALANNVPSRITLHAKAKPEVWSADPGSAALAVRWIGAPSELLSGAPTMLGMGGALTIGRLTV